ncbi:MAG: DUF721 domain-containing protein [Planctomycetes bacterium]|nr:DUF721 domain-containing protein [Planctomycetota bacterium]
MTGLPRNNPEGMSDEEFEALEVWRKRTVVERKEKEAARVRSSLVGKDSNFSRVTRNVLPDPEKFAESVKKFLKKSGMNWVKKHQHFSEIWYNTVGPEISENTMPVSFAKGILTIEVFSNALKHELENFFKAELIQSMNKELGKTPLRDIKFKLGTRE